MAAADTHYHSPFGIIEVRRYPLRRNDHLQAWCAADTLLLEQIHTVAVHGADVLVVNDEHGALCVALQAGAMWTDSALAALALQHNLALNQRPPVPVVWSTASPPGAPALVAMRVPKQLSYFEYQLAQLAACLQAGTPVLVAAMDKHLTPRVAELLEQYIGPTQRHRGERKARLFSAVRDHRSAGTPRASASYDFAALAGPLVALPNVFSQDRLDGGSRLLLEHLDTLAPAGPLLDLACGNGVLGIVAWQRGLCQSAVFCDESAMAIESARRNTERLFGPGKTNFSFHHGDGLVDYRGAPADLILCNPPFHLNHAVEEFAGRRLLAQCARHLQPGGRLCLVANRHLRYLPTLRRYFRQVDQIARNSKFILWLARAR